MYRISLIIKKNGNLKRSWTKQREKKKSDIASGGCVGQKDVIIGFQKRIPELKKQFEKRRKGQRTAETPRAQTEIRIGNPRMLRMQLLISGTKVFILEKK
jgi:hypothetical protein